jgi:drug/metabolite transporter (DMT)-like permease
MTAVALACMSAVCFGAMSVATRLAFRQGGTADVAAAGTVLGGLLVAFAVAAVEAARDGAGAGRVWPFALTGLLAPGASTIFIAYAIRDVGASRTSIVLGTAPGVSVAIALVFLGEPLRLALLAGALLIVAGGIALGREQGRPGHLRAIGLLFAVTGTVLFSVRDTLVRWLSLGQSPPPGIAAAMGLATGFLLIVATLSPRLRRHSWRTWIPFLPVGVLFGTSYVLLFEAYYRGRVEVVAPLIASESMWAVLFATLLLSRTEPLQREVVLGAACVVAGGVLIGLFQ